MALDATKARSAPTGALSVGATGATAPTGTGSALTGFTDLGYISEDGVTATLPGEGDVTSIRAWQNGAIVRTFRSPSEDSPTFSGVLMETKLETIELYYNATVTQTSTEGAFEYENGTRPYKSYVLDVVDGTELERTYIPRGVITEVGDKVYVGTDVIGYEVTIAADLDSVKGYNFKTWMTALKSS